MSSKLKQLAPKASRRANGRPAKLAGAMLVLAAGSAGSVSAHSLAPVRGYLLLPQIVDLAAAAARSAAVPAPGIQIFEAGKLVSQDVTEFNPRALDTSAFGDTDDGSR